MIQVTRLNGTTFMVNADLIELIEGTPDTVLTLNNEHKYVVRESVEDVLSRIVSYKRAIYADGPRIL